MATNKLSAAIANISYSDSLDAVFRNAATTTRHATEKAREACTSKAKAEQAAKLIQTYKDSTEDGIKAVFDVATKAFKNAVQTLRDGPVCRDLEPADKVAYIAGIMPWIPAYISKEGWRAVRFEDSKTANTIRNAKRKPRNVKTEKRAKNTNPNATPPVVDNTDHDLAHLKDQNSQKEKRINELATENAKLKTENNKLKKDNKALRAEVESLTAMISDLMDQAKAA